MPYILPEDRRDIESVMIGEYTPQNAGELQYVIALLVHNYLSQKGLNYQNCNNILGALNGASQEFYREVVAPYENSKIKSNGPVYTFDTYLRTTY